MRQWHAVQNLLGTYTLREAGTGTQIGHMDRQADAVLAARAPDMLTLLKRANNFIGCWDGGPLEGVCRCKACTYLRTIDAAIRKATETEE